MDWRSVGLMRCVGRGGDDANARSVAVLHLDALVLVQRRRAASTPALAALVY